MTATWTVRRVDAAEVTPEYLFGVIRRHRMLPENVDVAVSYCRTVAPSCIVLEIANEDGEKVADAIISAVVDGEDATLDLMVVSRFFAKYTAENEPNEVPFNELTASALRPVLDRLMEAKRLRRITSAIPRSRNRTYNALLACGFREEGKMRRAVKLRGKEPETLVVMGLLPDKE